MTRNQIKVMSHCAICALIKQNRAASSVGAASENCCQLSDIIIYE